MNSRDIQLFSVVQVVNQNEKTEKNEILVEVDIQEQKTCIWKLVRILSLVLFFLFLFFFSFFTFSSPPELIVDRSAPDSCHRLFILMG